MTHTCKSCGAKSLVLFEGGVCKKCFDEGLVNKSRSDKGRYSDPKVRLMRKHERIRKKILAGTAKLMSCANPQCAMEFYQGHPNQIYCTDACNRKVNNRKQWLRKKGRSK